MIAAGNGGRVISSYGRRGMRSRVHLGRFFIRLGRFIQSLAIMVMRPDDLVEFSRQFYASQKEIRYWSNEELLQRSLSPLELAALERIPVKTGRALVLGVGGGREAIPLHRAGFVVDGLDFVPEMVRQAQENAARQGINLGGLVQEVSQLDVPPGSYDLIWLTNSMYSCVPTRGRRVAMLRRIRRALKLQGYFYCSFHWEKLKIYPAPLEWIRKLFALLSRGNLSYETGDMLWGTAEFLHAFASKEELEAEFAAGAFDLFQLQAPERGVEAGAMLTPRKETDPHTQEG
jgi:2-polyprenyl-3-methyl-5-hydroxy-6-metoxy-1,4-benzoquinol methylase